MATGATATGVMGSGASILMGGLVATSTGIAAVAEVVAAADTRVTETTGIQIL